MLQLRNLILSSLAIVAMSSSASAAASPYLHDYDDTYTGTWKFEDVKVSKRVFKVKANEPAYRALEATTEGGGYPVPSSLYWRIYGDTPEAKEYVDSLDPRLTYNCTVGFVAGGTLGYYSTILYANQISCQPED